MLFVNFLKADEQSGDEKGQVTVTDVTSQSLRPTATSTPTPTSTNTPTPIPTATNTPTPTATNTPTPTATNTPTPTATNTPTPTPTMTPEEIDLARLWEQHEEKQNTYNYVRMREIIADKSYAYPVINITTLDGVNVWAKDEKESEDYLVRCIVDVFNCSDDFIISESGTIRVRGNSSAESTKTRQEAPGGAYPYKIKLDSKQNVLGLNDGSKFKDWVLLKGDYHTTDHIMGFRLFDTLCEGMYYSSDACFVHVFINGKDKGLYTLCEQNEVKKNRVRVTEPAEDYEGTDIGYFLEIDNYYGSDENPYIKLNHEKAKVTDVQGMSRTFKTRGYTIHSEITSDAQKKFIEAYMKNAFKILYEAVEKDNYLMFDEDYNLVSAEGVYGDAKETVAAILDLDSVVASYLTQEITTNYDRGEGSFYMAIDFSPKSIYEKITFLAPWDFEWGYFGSSVFDGGSYKLLAGAFDTMWEKQFGDRSNPWFVLLMKEDWFREMVREKWAKMYTGGEIEKMLVELSNYLDYGANDLKATGKYNGAFGIINNVRNRMKWLDENWFGENAKNK